VGRGERHQSLPDACLPVGRVGRAGRAGRPQEGLIDKQILTNPPFEGLGVDTTIGGLGVKNNF